MGLRWTWLASKSFGLSAISCIGLTSGMPLSVRVAGAKSALVKRSRLNGRIPVCWNPDKKMFRVVIAESWASLTMLGNS